jgi:hypothetical protein
MARYLDYLLDPSQNYIDNDVAPPPTRHKPTIPVAAHHIANAVATAIHHGDSPHIQAIMAALAPPQAPQGDSPQIQSIMSALSQTPAPAAQAPMAPRHRPLRRQAR